MPQNSLKVEQFSGEENDGDWLHVVMKRDDQLTDLGNRDHIDTERRVSGLRREFQTAKRLEELLRDLIC